MYITGWGFSRIFLDGRLNAESHGSLADGGVSGLEEAPPFFVLDDEAIGGVLGPLGILLQPTSQ